MVGSSHVPTSFSPFSLQKKTDCKGSRTTALPEQSENSLESLKTILNETELSYSDSELLRLCAVTIECYLWSVLLPCIIAPLLRVTVTQCY